MKKLIEIFQWHHEGEYEQSFYVVNDEEQFIKDMMEYLNTEQVKEEYPWSDSLSDFLEELQVEPYFLSRMEHINDTYFLNFGYSTGFTLSKRTLDYKSEDIK